MLPGTGRLIHSRLGLAQGRHLGNDRGVLAIVLRGHAIEDLRVIVGRLVTDPHEVDLGVGQGLPEGVALGP